MNEKLKPNKKSKKIHLKEISFNKLFIIYFSVTIKHVRYLLYLMIQIAKY